MNPQPYATPPRWWPSHLDTEFVAWWAGVRDFELHQQRIHHVDVSGEQHVAEALSNGNGVLIVSNHSFHYDSYVLIEAGRRGQWFPHFMTAWQVFALTGSLGKFLLQKHGCFSINREGTDTQAIRQAISILCRDAHPLVIFPEGDIYHSNDRVMPFREGAAAIALSAKKKSDRPIVVIPCGMKCFYTSDPREELGEMMSRLEDHIRWRPRPDLPLLERIYRFGNGFLSLKEVEYLGQPRPGAPRERIGFLSRAILDRLEARHGLPKRDASIHDRIRNVRVHVIKLTDKLRSPEPDSQPSPEDAKRVQAWQQDMDDLFFVTQLSSYHGDYSSEKPTTERLAEAIDKFEEDIFGLQAPTPRAMRRAAVQFGEPLDLASESFTSLTLSKWMEAQVQRLLDQLTAASEAAAAPS